MTAVNETQVECLKSAFEKLLGKPSPGTMAYVRCLGADVIAALCGPQLLNLSGWDVFGVIGEGRSEGNFITADRAVDLREEKQGSVLLLVDAKEAGAGMDGIYSAVREIKEAELIPSATDVVLKRLQRDEKEFAQAAYRQARLLGRANAISPWREFEFYSRCASRPDDAGEHVTVLGLWPIRYESDLRKEDIQISAQIVERLLLPSSTNLTVSMRVESLLLPPESAVAVRGLELFLRETSGLRWTESVLRACGHPDLWLNAICPGFVNEEIRSIELVPWRSRPDAAPLAWSGLAKGEENIPVFLINEQDRDKSKLEVRWKTLPKDIKAGAVEYKVSIVTGSESELVARQAGHAAKDTQRCAFTGGDFEELDEGGKWEAKVRIHPVGTASPDGAEASDGALWRESEPFILTFGTKSVTARSSVGKKVRAIVEEAIKLSDEEFEAACRVPMSEDGQGYLSYRVNGKSGRVFRSPLIKAVEEDWQLNGYQLGRWVVRVRTEGSRMGALEFVPIERGSCDPEVWRKTEDATRLMGQRALERSGFIGLIHRGNEASTASYVNAWVAALDSASPQLALAHTIEVQSLSGDTLGLIVLPSHPIRVAWHQAYDELAYHARYAEGLKATDVVKTLRSLDGSYMPAYLPGLKEGSSFVFGDMIGFYAVAMIRDGESEPQATIAQMVRCLSTNTEDAAPSVGLTTASAVAREVEKYIDLHPQYGMLRLNALRPGDGLTVARALGLTLSRGTREEGAGEAQRARPAYVLDLFPSSEAAGSRVVGRFLSETAERRRAGAGGVTAEDKWMLETFEVNGMSVPRLKWAKRSTVEPEEPAHLSVAFDTFEARVEAIDEADASVPRPLEAFGLIPSITRRFTFKPIPTWISTIAAQVEGEKHPAARSLSERLQRIQSGVMRAVAANLSGNRQSWPSLKTQLNAEQAYSVRHLHELSDWVITVDRNAGIEYFDAPGDAADIYETYVIDCVPERQDLDSVQLVTSTSNIDEVMRLLDQTLEDMALSCSPRNCTFLLGQLKAISGRLAMRLASRGHGRGELIALAMFYANCVNKPGHRDWPSMQTGFIVPLDDVRELLLDGEGTSPGGDDDDDGGRLRADLIYVDLSRRGALQFTFIEIKYRRLLKSARENSLPNRIGEQTSQTRKRWTESYFSQSLTQTQLALRRKRLARALHFYLSKAIRHGLSGQPSKRLAAAIDGLFRTSTEQAWETVEDRGYIFCPEFSSEATEIAFDGATRIYLFGPQGLPEMPAPPRLVADSRDTDSHGSEQPVSLEPSPVATVQADFDEDTIDGAAKKPDAADEQVALTLGHSSSMSTPVSWSISIRGNPHLMIVGLPGMGKTTCIINICEQLFKQGITPLVFAYHDDIEARLAERLGDLSFADLGNGLGFNPLRVTGRTSHDWLDNVGMVRDIFTSVYPDLGDLQTSEIRESIKQSYIELGYGKANAMPGSLPVPEFKRFYEIIRGKAKPNAGLIARLEELNDYGFFDGVAAQSSLLDSPRPTIIRLYETQNAVLQCVASSFVLLNLYQNMFLRGAQSSLTHAIIFDEAHRASRLKLLPTMAKECRKFGLALVVASQEAKDFSPSLYAAIANYLVLRLTEVDAKALAKNVIQSSEANTLSGRLKQLAKYTAMFFAEGKRPTSLRLLD